MITRRGLFGLLFGTAVYPVGPTRKTEEYEWHPYTVATTIRKDDAVKWHVVDIDGNPWPRNRIIEQIYNESFND